MSTGLWWWEKHPPEPDPKPESIVDLYGDSSLRGVYHQEKVYDMLRRRHKRSTRAAVQQLEVRPPLGVKIAFRLPLTWNQLVSRYPWKVVWLSKGRRLERKQMTLGGALVFWAKARRQNKTATIVSRVRGYDIPHKYRGKLPKGWKWCPYCMQPRKYHPVFEETFYARIKAFDKVKEQYVWRERRLQLMRCPICLMTNRDPVFRRSNQPWELRKIKRGARRVKPRKRYRR